MQKTCFFLAFFALKFRSHHGRSDFRAAVFSFSGVIFRPRLPGVSFTFRGISFTLPGFRSISLHNSEFRSVCLEYIHYNSAKYCSIYAIGYTDDFAKAEDQTYRKVDALMQQDWYFSTKAFTEFKEKLQDRIRWNYSGETEILVLQNNPGQRNVLNFQNYVAIDVNKGIREGYIDSFQSFMESLIRSSKRRVTVKEAISDVRNARISVKDILAGAIDDCKKVPTPIKEIAKDRLFYRCANTY